MSSRRVALLGAWVGACGLALTLPARTELVLDRTALFADGRSTVRARVASRSLLGTYPLLAPGVRPLVDPAKAAALGVTLWPAHDGSLVVRAGTRAGALPVQLVDAHGRERANRHITLREDPADLDEDGLPDVAELVSEEQRAAFTAWFTSIAEAQRTAIDDRWARVHQDCAGLVRFAFKEALREHDRTWRERWRFLPNASLPEVTGLRYPALPIIGALPFRKAAGAYDPGRSLEAQLTAAPSARTLWQHNSVRIASDAREAHAGDLLFFHVPHDTGSRMHTMIALGAHPGATHHDPASRVVYHTGQPDEHGEVRLVTLDALRGHPDPGWHPVASNPRFAGVYRLSHLVHEQRAEAHLAWRPLPQGTP